MSRRGSWWRSGLTVTLVVGVVFACNGIRQDEFLCEDAVSHLQDCCPGLRPSNMGCTYDDRGCNGTTYPELAADQSDCIRGESCDTLVSSGVCARVLALPPYNPDDYCTCPGSGCTCDAPNIQVCP